MEGRRRRALKEHPLLRDRLPARLERYRGQPVPPSIFASDWTVVINGNMVKTISWYDNEWGYSCRTAELISKLARLDEAQKVEHSWTAIAITLA